MNKKANKVEGSTLMMKYLHNGPIIKVYFIEGDVQT